MCRRSLVDLEYDSGHSEHLYGFSPVWILMWRFNSPEFQKAFLHSMQLEGFSAVWYFLCFRRLFKWEKDLWHLSQENDISPGAVWTLICFCRLLAWLNDMSHCEQENGLSSAWILQWISNLPDCENDSEQWEHLKIFSLSAFSVLKNVTFNYFYYQHRFQIYFN